MGWSLAAPSVKIRRNQAEEHLRKAGQVQQEQDEGVENWKKYKGQAFLNILRYLYGP